MSASTRSGVPSPSDARQHRRRPTPCEDERRGDLLVMQRADLLERVRERIVADVVQQRGDLRDDALLDRDPAQLAALIEERERGAREVIGAERVLEARVRGAGIDEIREAELPDVSQALKNRRVDELQGERVDTNVVPERVA